MVRPGPQGVLGQTLLNPLFSVMRKRRGRRLVRNRIVAGFSKGQRAERRIGFPDQLNRPISQQFVNRLVDGGITLLQQARHLTPDRPPRLTSPVPLDVSDTATEISPLLRSQLGAYWGSNGTPIHRSVFMICLSQRSINYRKEQKQESLTTTGAVMMKMPSLICMLSLSYLIWK